MQRKKTAIVWFTNNLRVRDNRILYEACLSHDKVIGIYCFDKSLFDKRQFGFKKIERFRAKFLHHSVTELQTNLEAHNISLIVDFSFPEEFVPKMCKRFDADTLYVQEEFTEEELQKLNEVTANLKEGIDVVRQYDQFLMHPKDLPFRIEDIPSVFSNFRRKVEKYNKILHEVNIPVNSSLNLVENNSEIPSLKQLGFQDFEQPEHSAFPYKGGETAVLDRLNYYFFESRKLSFYLNTRNGLKGTDYSSKFSAWLSNGSISARTIYWKVKEYEHEFGSNKSTYWLVVELLWRDFFKYIALKHGNRLFQLQGIKRLDYLWNTSEELVSSWIEGSTTEPFVNANMIEIQQTGWMSNRGRQIVASYFAKELQLDWRIGAAYFESMLIDYDVHSNYGNWQYISGVGNDPRDRKFNVKLQAERYDPRGVYQRTWLQPTLF